MGRSAESGMGTYMLDRNVEHVWGAEHPSVGGGEGVHVRSIHTLAPLCLGILSFSVLTYEP